MTTGEIQNLSPPQLPLATSNTQEPPSRGENLELVKPDDSVGGIEECSIPQVVKSAMEGSASQGVRILVQGVCQMQELAHKELRTERNEGRLETNKYRTELEAERIKSARLEEQLKNGIKIQALQNGMLTLGGALFGAGIQPLFSAFSWPYLMLAVLGAILVWLGLHQPKNN